MYVCIHINYSFSDGVRICSHQRVLLHKHANQICLYNHLDVGLKIKKFFFLVKTFYCEIFVKNFLTYLIVILRGKDLFEVNWLFNRKIKMREKHVTNFTKKKKVLSKRNLNWKYCWSKRQVWLLL